MVHTGFFGRLCIGVGVRVSARGLAVRTCGSDLVRRGRAPVVVDAWRRRSEPGVTARRRITKSVRTGLLLIAGDGMTPAMATTVKLSVGW